LYYHARITLPHIVTLYVTKQDVPISIVVSPNP
jgi:hypothetical protein